jgi:hypothetical protein
VYGNDKDGRCIYQDSHYDDGGMDSMVVHGDVDERRAFVMIQTYLVLRLQSADDVTAEFQALIFRWTGHGCWQWRNVSGQWSLLRIFVPDIPSDNSLFHGKSLVYKYGDVLSRIRVSVPVYGRYSALQLIYRHSQHPTSQIWNIFQYKFCHDQRPFRGGVVSSARQQTTSSEISLSLIPLNPSILPIPNLLQESRHIDLLSLHLGHPGMFQHPPGRRSPRRLLLQTALDEVLEAIAPLDLVRRFILQFGDRLGHDVGQ